MIASGVQRDGLGAGRDAEVDLGADRRENCAVADDPGFRQRMRVGGACRRGRVLARRVGWELHGLRKRRNTQSGRRKSNQQTLDPKISS